MKSSVSDGALAFILHTSKRTRTNMHTYINMTQLDSEGAFERRKIELAEMQNKHTYIYIHTYT
jgi:hypothetical protein